jgi:NAD(P)-dependent dehydrogenase (short-subunit alcohol dehydrogenase family)
MATTTLPHPNPTVLITGANRGIGLAILQRLALSPATSHYTFLLGSRSPSAGQSALTTLRSPPISIPASTQIYVVELDVTSDASIRRAVETITSRFGRLDVLINNAGYAAIPKEDMSDYRETFSQIFDVNVTSVGLLTSLCLPLLRQSATLSPSTGGRVVNISSGRGSLSRAAAGELPPSISIAYDVSKAALNRLIVGMVVAPENRGVEFQLVNPGHCKTAFNGYKGVRDPVSEGATAVVELLGREKGAVEVGVWETKGRDAELLQVPW